MTLKINMYPSFTNECSFEFKSNEQSIDFIVIKSAYLTDEGKAYYRKLNNAEKVDKLIKKIRSFHNNPTPKKYISIADGLMFRLIFEDLETNMDFNLSSIQNNSVEMSFINELFDLCNTTIDDPDFLKYLATVKENYLNGIN